MIDVTNSTKTFGQLSQELSVNKFGYVDTVGDWGYLHAMEDAPNRFAHQGANSLYGEPSPHFPEMTDVSPATIKSKAVHENGEVELFDVVKVFAYDD